MIYDYITWLSACNFRAVLLYKSCNSFTYSNFTIRINTIYICNIAYFK
nr:MAG TPA: hypothetical protein [Crassvirales sp.]